MRRKVWQEKVAYQIYPKSFYDSNGDGIGDLRGIIEKLDYLQDLGIELLWICPIFDSPLADQGYDISDYYRIHPSFGTMEDMEDLIREAKQRGIGILLDLVVNHCSDEHPWFIEATKDPEGKYGKYFHLKKAENGRLPNNLRSYFGGSVWEKLPNREDYYYMHLFHRKQPDLNWENKELREEVYRMINWWLNKGLAGFRVDAITNIKKAVPFRDYPADREDGLAAVCNMLQDAQGLGDLLRDLKEQTFQKYDCFTVGEAFDVSEEEMPNFIGDDGYFSTIFNFNTVALGKSANGWYDRKPISATEYIKALFRSQKDMNPLGFIANIIENHDEPRAASHYLPEPTEAGKKLLGLISFMLRGIPFVYQGQEIGMENSVFSALEEMDDVVTYDEYQVAKAAGLSDGEALAAVARYSRDNTRTPMQWDATENAGFTEGKPWLKVNPKYICINVADQIDNPDSVLSFYKKLIALRKHPEYKECIVYGEMIPMETEDTAVMTFLRKGDGKELFVVANIQNQEATIVLPKPVKSVLLQNGDDLQISSLQLQLKPYQAAILEL